MEMDAAIDGAERARMSADNQREQAVAPVDEVLPANKLFFFGLQHVLVMYAGAIAVPILIGGAAKLSMEEIGFLISADLFVCGVASIIQSVGIWKFGIRLPLMMGCTFAAVPPMMVMVSNPETGLLGMFGAIIAAGLITMLLAPLVGRLIKLFPPVVTGTVITVTGLNLIPVGVNWVAGRGQAVGDPVNLLISLIVLLSIITITKYASGFLRNVAVLIGIGIGFAVAAILGKVDFSRMSNAHWFEFIAPMHFGVPQFDIGPIIALSVIMIVVMVETTGMMLAVAEMVGKKVNAKDITRGLRVDGLATFIGGIFNTFPYVTYSQNVGLVGVTGIKSRWVCAAAGLIMIVLALLPKLSIVFALIPQSVLGGAGIVMFGMVVATGIKVLADVNYSKESSRHNLFIVAVSMVMGMIPMVNPGVFSRLPQWLSPFTHSGIVLAALTALLLNLYLNGYDGKLSDDAIAQRVGS
ncbi:nucleobase:cation symporter-2 family protein [Eoetvoesiella caeni]|uniref:NCS2 family nucleobase:cation symporter-2 n=1 Tax=Eoetvoesiella caeni TaxID=645616 RepID=A0A366HFJ7_9BURK|nr:nucleobase:cation symporter-2 family protein [Eoetvoesiella caeni]MCI2808724.1 purine permease [Eoetvoesiella caeni]RBP40753.1 NCS2 family nucleobase:cation symporter-2 [Eoetvoesiella caeni]